MIKASVALFVVSLLAMGSFVLVCFIFMVLSKTCNRAATFLQNIYQNQNKYIKSKQGINLLFKNTKKSLTLL